MTNKQINAAIAEACGWVPDCDRGICWDQHGNAIITAPNYCNDLKAMHDAEEILSPHQRDQMRLRLNMAIGNEYWRASARERAKAFLLTLGKWSATDKDSLTVGATTEESSEVQSTSSGGSGGASTYGGKGLGIAGAIWPPETRITVNGKTFCLADIDKEMVE